MNNAYTHDYDCLIIGGGLAGLICGLKCLDQGLSCAIVSAGMSALHFSSGSIDLLGYHPERTVVTDPFAALPGFIGANPLHPYAKCGIEEIAGSLDYFQQEMAAAGSALFSNGRNNHFHITAVGTLKPTYFSPDTVFTQEMKTVFEQHPAIAILNIRGFRDFHPLLAAGNLKKHKLFAGCRIITGEISLPGGKAPADGMVDMRSVDIARILDATADWHDVADALTVAAGQARIVGLPAFLGLNRYREILSELRRATGRLIYEIPTLPPSILGMRLDNILKSRFVARGGVIIASETVGGGRIENDRVISVRTQNQGEDIRAAAYVLATGSFFSKGLASRYGRMTEPLFDCRLRTPPDRESLSATAFLSPDSHDFLRAGVITNQTLNPETASGQTITNLFCAGAVLADYNPVSEGSGGGVAVATGFSAARRIAESLRAGSDHHWKP